MIHFDKRIPCGVTIQDLIDYAKEHNLNTMKTHINIKHDYNFNTYDIADTLGIDDYDNAICLGDADHEFIES